MYFFSNRVLMLTDQVSAGFLGDLLREDCFFCMFPQLPNRLGTKHCISPASRSKPFPKHLIALPAFGNLENHVLGLAFCPLPAVELLPEAFGAVERRFQQVPPSAQPSWCQSRTFWMEASPIFCCVEPISTPWLPMFQNLLGSWARGDVLLVCSSRGSNQALYVLQQAPCSD